MKALGWFLALFTFWMALLLTGSEILTTKDASGEEQNGRSLFGFEKGKRYVFRAREIPSGNETRSTAAAEYHVLVDDLVPGREVTLTVSLRPVELAAPAAAPHAGKTYRMIVGMDGYVKAVHTLDVADASGGDATKLRQLRASFESILNQATRS